MTDQRKKQEALGKASLILASGTVVSRLLGFASAVILARTLGTVGAGADTFALANQLPNSIYAIVAGGVLSAILVPHIVKAGTDSDNGQGFVNKIVTLGFVIFVSVAALATVCAPGLVALYAQSGEGGERGLSTAEISLAVGFAYWCLPQILFYALYSLFSEILNARGVFGPFTWAPALNNMVAITGLVIFNYIFSGQGVEQAESWTPNMIMLIAGIATLGVASQALVLLLFWRKAKLGYRPDFRWWGTGLGKAGKAVSWMFGMILVAQVAGIVQANVASLAAGGDTPSLAILRFSWLVFMLPHSVVAVSLATAYFTRMSTNARDGKFSMVVLDFRDSVSRIGFFMVLAQIGIVVLALPFSRQFGGAPEQMRAMATVVILYGLGLVIFSVFFVVQRVFYSLEDTKTPFLLQVVHSSVFISLALVSTTLETKNIAYGLALSASVSGLVQVILALGALRRRLGKLGLRKLAVRYLRFYFAALPTALVGVGLLIGFGGPNGQDLLESTSLSSALVMVIITICMTIVYLGILLVLRDTRALELTRALRRQSKPAR